MSHDPASELGAGVDGDQAASNASKDDKVVPNDILERAKAFEDWTRVNSDRGFDLRVLSEGLNQIAQDAYSYPHSFQLAEWLALAAIRAIPHYGSLGQIAAIEGLYGAVSRSIQNFVGSEAEILEQWRVQAAAEAVTAFVHLGNERAAKRYLDEATTYWKGHRREYGAARGTASAFKAMIQLVTQYGDEGQYPAETYLQNLQVVASNFEGDEVITEELVSGAISVMRFHALRGNARAAKEKEIFILAHCDSFPGNPKFAALREDAESIQIDTLANKAGGSESFGPRIITPHAMHGGANERALAAAVAEEERRKAVERESANNAGSYFKEPAVAVPNSDTNDRAADGPTDEFSAGSAVFNCSIEISFRNGNEGVTKQVPQKYLFSIQVPPTKNGESASVIDETKASLDSQSPSAISRRGGFLNSKLSRDWQREAKLTVRIAAYSLYVAVAALTVYYAGFSPAPRTASQPSAPTPAP